MRQGSAGMRPAILATITVLSLAAAELAQAQVTEDVTWTNRVGVYAAGTGSSLLKPYGSSAWNAGGSSTRAILSGDGYAEFTHSADGYKMAGLSNGDSDATYQDIDFAIYEASTALYIYENGVGVAGGWAAAEGDRLRVEVSVGARREVRFSSWRRMPSTSSAPKARPR